MEQKTTLSGLWSFLDSGKVLPHCSGLYLFHLEDIILPNRLNKYTVFPQKGGKKSKAWWDLQHKLSNKNPMLNVSLGFQSPVHPTSLPHALRAGPGPSIPTKSLAPNATTQVYPATALLDIATLVQIH